MNLAQLFGPSIGGAIYGAGGFYAPFVVMGAVQITMSLISIPFLPECKRKELFVNNRSNTTVKDGFLKLTVLNNFNFFKTTLKKCIKPSKIF